MRTKTQEKIKEAKMYYGMVINDCFGSRDLLTYMKLRKELSDMGYEADERDNKVVFKKFED